MIGDLKEVYFEKYCKDCKYAQKTEAEDPCWDCLKEPANQDSHKPVRFEPKERSSERI